VARDRQVEQFRNDLESERSKAIEEFRSDIAFRATKRQRLANEVIAWSVPILDGIDDLYWQLGNIVHGDFYQALDPSGNENLPSDWSITYDYGMNSTLYMFAKYFCWMGLLEDRLNFDFFDSAEERDAFFDQMWKPRTTLAQWPLRKMDLSDCSGPDRQIFAIEQRGIGAAMCVTENGERGCLSYAAFLEKKDDPPLQNLLKPLRSFLEALTPDSCRGKRLLLMHEELAEAREQWKKKLRQDIASGVQPPLVPPVQPRQPSPRQT
jgi:hypothetical protein